MAHELQLDPERLHLHGRRLSALLDALAPLPAVDADTRATLGRTPAGAAVLAELDRAAAAVDRAGRELSELAAGLHVAAYAAAEVDGDTAGRLGELAPRP